MAIFKLHARSSAGSGSEGGAIREGAANENVVAELVEMFTVLIAASGFLESEGGGGSGSGVQGERRLERDAGGGDGKVRVFT